MSRVITLMTAMIAMIAAGAAGEAGDFVIVCPIEGMIDDGVNVLVERTVREADGAKAIIFVIDTPGGLLDAGIEITKTILEAPCQTIAYPTGMGAISAGALISYACQAIVMAPDANIGAATPVIMSPEGMQPTSEKEVSFMRAKMRALAERNGHNPAIAEAMVDKDIELRSYVNDEGRLIVYKAGGPDAPPFTNTGSTDVTQKVVKRIAEAVDTLPSELDGFKDAVKDILPPEGQATPAETSTTAATPAEDGSQLVLPADKLLTLTAQEAVRYGLCPTTANSVDEVMAFFQLHGMRKYEIEMTWSEALFRWLTSPLVAGILLMLGIGGIYMEMKTPGFGVFGAVGLICLALFFGSHLLIGLAEWIDVVLVAGGIVLLLVEILIIPGFGMAGFAGITCLIIGLYLSLVRVPIPQYSWDFARLTDAGLSLVVAGLTLVLMVYIFWKVFPRTPLFGWLVLGHSQQADQGYTVQSPAQVQHALGLKGVATSMLRPAGRGRFGDQTYQVVTEGGFIAQDTPIVIVKAEGNRYVVKPVGGSPKGSEDTSR
ncbi:MAG TPA: NfeD family protein [Candidatus Hydrogenedentes bacterium]|nr:NfeD family protein [Candidatus Hydrogenedentota bacterium]HPG67265.1 NfeD family protein [Candidatus Hydrogenedentota bacterium]